MDFGVYFLYDFSEKSYVDANDDDNDDYDDDNDDGDNDVDDGENTDRLIFAL